MERIGKYIVHKMAATTGYGKILFCQDPDLRIPVAVKLFAPRVSQLGLMSLPQWQSRFHEEARALASFDHPHVIGVKTMEHGPDGRPFFVMPYMAAHLPFEIGKDNDPAALAQRVPLARALMILKQTASALSALHRRGMVHRMVRPSNLLLTARENGQVKLADFSMVKLAERNPPFPDHWPAATDYCAPEQRENASGVDARADVYSLGVLVYRLLSGALPDLAQGVAVLPDRHPAVLVDLVAQCTDPDPARRPAHAGMVLQTLGAVPAEALAKPKVQVVPVRRAAGAAQAVLARA